MPKITFLPINQVIETTPGETILEAAIRNDIPLEHACGGFCSCTTCQVEVESGSENISIIDEEENDRLDCLMDRTSKSRLGCQSKVNGDITVRIVNLT